MGRRDEWEDWWDVACSVVVPVAVFLVAAFLALAVMTVWL